MEIGRRKALGGIAAAACAPMLANAQTRAASAVAPAGKPAEFTLKFANNLPASHPLNVQARGMASAIRSDTRGAVELQIFPNNELGNDTEMLRKLRAGEIDFFTLSGLLLSSVVPVAAISGVGFAFPNYDAIWAALDGGLGGYIRNQIAKNDLVAMDRIWDNGFRQITTTTRPINTVDDLRGLKLRVPNSPMWVSMFKALQAVPTTINFSEVYPALETRQVDGQENPLAVINAAKLYEVQKFCAMTYHMWDGFWFLANKGKWSQLPEDVRGVISKRANAAATAQRVDVIIANSILQKELSSRGLTFNQPNSDSFRLAMKKAGFYADWKEKFGPEAWRLLEAHTGRLA